MEKCKKKLIVKDGKVVGRAKAQRKDKGLFFKILFCFGFLYLDHVKIGKRRPCLSFENTVSIVLEVDHVNSIRIQPRVEYSILHHFLKLEMLHVLPE